MSPRIISRIISRSIAALVMAAGLLTPGRAVTLEADCNATGCRFKLVIGRPADAPAAPPSWFPGLSLPERRGADI